MTCRVIVADDHPFFLSGVEHVCETMPNIDIVATATSCDGLMACLKEQEASHPLPCDVLVTDFSMPGSRQQDGLRLLSTLRRLHPSMRIIVLTMSHKYRDIIDKSIIYGRFFTMGRSSNTRPCNHIKQ